MALHSNVMNSKTVYGCQKHLNRVAKRYNVHIIWIPQHNDIPGICKAHELARRGTTIELFDEFLSIKVPFGSLQAHD